MKMITPEMVEEMIERKVREVLAAAMEAKRLPPTKHPSEIYLAGQNFNQKRIIHTRIR